MMLFSWQVTAVLAESNGSYCRVYD